MWGKKSKVELLDPDFGVPTKTLIEIMASIGMCRIKGELADVVEVCNDVFKPGLYAVVMRNVYMWNADGDTSSSATRNVVYTYDVATEGLVHKSYGVEDGLNLRDPEEMQKWYGCELTPPVEPEMKQEVVPPSPER